MGTNNTGMQVVLPDGWKFWQAKWTDKRIIGVGWMRDRDCHRQPTLVPVETCRNLHPQPQVWVFADTGVGFYETWGLGQVTLWVMYHHTNVTLFPPPKQPLPVPNKPPPPSNQPPPPSNQPSWQYRPKWCILCYLGPRYVFFSFWGFFGY